MQDLGLEGRAIDEGRKELDRAQVGKEAETLAQAEERLLRPHRRLGVVPLRPADRAEEDGVGAAAEAQRRVRQGGAELVDRGAADDHLLEGELNPVAPADRFQHTHGLGGDFGADPVAGKDGHIVCSHEH